MTSEEFLLNQLNEHRDDDVTIPYGDVALLFPSSAPHPDTFEYRIIDSDRLLAWGKLQGWKIELESQLNRVRFTRIE